MKHKRILALALAALCVFTGCGKNAKGNGSAEESVTLKVVTSYGETDGNRANYEVAYKAYQSKTGNVIEDNSSMSTEEWKASVIAAFAAGNEPDVLFFFTRGDSDSIVRSGKVVSISEIRSVFPDYGNNMKDSLLPVAPVDGKQYAIPVNGFWEGLFVNKKVIEAAGAKIPDANTNWEEFGEICQTIKDAGYVPVAVSLAEVPHYWFEFTIFNHTSLNTHSNLPDSAKDSSGKAWVAGLNDIRDFYERGFFPKNTLTASNDEIYQLMVEDGAAFTIDGSWQLGWFAQNLGDRIDDYVVTYVPGSANRRATDLIADLTMGYYITRKAWDERRDAAVGFVTYMTTDIVVNTFGATSVTALKNGTTPPNDASSLVKSALDMTRGATGTAPAVQDGLRSAQRAALFEDIKKVVTGIMTPEKAIDDALSAK